MAEHRTHTDVGYVPYLTHANGNVSIGMKFRDLDHLRDNLRSWAADSPDIVKIAIEKVTITYAYEWVDGTNPTLPPLVPEQD